MSAGRTLAVSLARIPNVAVPLRVGRGVARARVNFDIQCPYCVQRRHFQTNRVVYVGKNNAIATTSSKTQQSVDHRIIGQEQKLFFTHDSSPGTPFLLPHGMRIVAKVERVIRDLYKRWGYDEVLSPQIFKASLWKQSGHWDNYRSDMFAVDGFDEMQQRLAAAAAKHGSGGGCCGDVAHAQEQSVDGDGVEGAQYGLKPMNCPGHCVMFQAQEHSYRDLPIRYAEFSPLHRNEASGALTGLTRVRRFHQDDAHVFCRVDQIYDEIAGMLVMLREAYTLFGFTSFELVLSTRPDKYLGDVEDWERAEHGLRQALEQSKLDWSINEGDGAFYGPKIDVRLIDAAGRHHQTATIQLDFQLPRRFDLWYMSPQGERVAPVMIHRAILGSLERFMAILTEHVNGRWPFWLSPRQAVVLPTSGDAPELVAYAQDVRSRLAIGMPSKTQAQNIPQHQAAPRQQHAFHVEIDASQDKLGKRVRRAHVDRFNFTCVVGKQELETGTVQVRSRDSTTANVDDSDGINPQSKGTSPPKLQQDMGTYTVEELRKLFIALDDHHW